jgi:hypothetical protein
VEEGTGLQLPQSQEVGHQCTVSRGRDLWSAECVKQWPGRGARIGTGKYRMAMGQLWKSPAVTEYDFTWRPLGWAESLLHHGQGIGRELDLTMAV